MFVDFVSKLLRHLSKLELLMAALHPSPPPLALPLLALVDLYPEADRLTIRLTLNGKVRTMDRAGSEQLKKCLLRIQLNASDKKQKCKKNKQTESVTPSLTVELLSNTVPVDSEICNSEAWKDNCVLRVGTDEFQVRLNTPRVLSLSLPKYTLQDCPIVPQVLLSRCERHSCHWSWYRIEDGGFSEETLTLALSHGTAGLSDQLTSTFKLIRVSDGFTYSPHAGDVGHKLLVLCQPLVPTSKQHSINQFVVTPNEVQLFPKLEGQIDRFMWTRQLTDNNHLRVVSYNLLADVWTNNKGCQTNIYPYCSSLSLDMDYRQALTNRELISYNADILCLQEVGKRRYADYLMPVMECAGFSGHFAAKAGEMPEGEVVLYRRDRFEAIDVYSLHSGEYMKIEENSVLNNSLLLWGEEVAHRFYMLGTIFQICILKDKSNPERVFIVANTHLHSRPSVPYIRLFQMALLVRHVEGLLLRYKETEGKTACVLLCGDFNSTPNNGLIEYLQTGCIESNNIDWQPWEIHVPTSFVFPGISLSHSIQLLNSCTPIDFTHFAGHYTGILDYIFCSSQHFSSQLVAPMPALWEISRETALPNTWFPSDHLPIVCDLEMK